MRAGKPWPLHSLIAGLVLFLAAVLAGGLWPAPAGARGLTKVRLQIHWIHQAQFAGFYLAKDAGLYQQAGLDVQIIPGGPGIDPLADLAKGKCDFATGWLSGGLELRSKGVDVVLLAQLIQRSALLLITMADRGITKVRQLSGRRVGLWGGHFDLLPHALFRRDGIKVQEVTQNASMAPLLLGAVDAACAMQYNEYHQLIQSGVNPDEMVVFNFADMGLNFPEDGIYCMEGLWRQKQALCRRFTKASLAGWRLAIDQPDLALASVMKRVDAARLASNRAHQRWMLRSMLRLITHRVGPNGLGQLDPKDFAMVNRVMVDQGLMKAPVEQKQFDMRAWSDKP